MKIQLDCLPCTMRQIVEASRMATDDRAVQEEIAAEAAKIAADYRSYPNTPAMSEEMHRTVKKYTGVEDPYAAVKNRDIEEALKIVPVLQRYLSENGDLRSLLKTAAVGNIIDSAIKGEVDIAGGVEKELEKEFAICDIESFADRMKNAKTLLILGDNAGETVFDRVMAEHLPHLSIIYAVRGAPAINDATYGDALASGLGSCTKIMSSGCGSPGLNLHRCSDEFLESFYSADIVLSKGQGNFEALTDAKRQIFFLLKAKCPVIADVFGVKLNSYLFADNQTLHLKL